MMEHLSRHLPKSREENFFNRDTSLRAPVEILFYCYTLMVDIKGFMSGPDPAP